MAAVDPAAAVRQHAADAVSVVARGLAECKMVDLQTEDLHCVTILVLARCADLTEGLQALYRVLDLLEDIGFLQLPSDAEFAERESEFQRMLVVVHTASSVKAAAATLSGHVKALDAAAKQRPRSMLTPLQLWQRQYGEKTPPPGRKLKPPPAQPENAWQLLAPERAPQSVCKQEMSRCDGAETQGWPSAGRISDRGARGDVLLVVVVVGCGAATTER